jgi:hypothetical protein
MRTEAQKIRKAIYNKQYRIKHAKLGLCTYGGCLNTPLWGGSYVYCVEHSRATKKFSKKDKLRVEKDLSKKFLKCRICGRRLYRTGSTRLNIDHCHKTNKYRGLLCNEHNTALGSFRDSVALLLKAITYLRNSK